MTGPLIGAVVIFGLQQLLQNYGSWSSLLTGLLLIVIIHVAPEGIWVVLRRSVARFVQFMWRPSLPQQEEDLSKEQS
jgi:ABC-type branched-subunit amino acid transport system permease subunit